MTLLLPGHTSSPLWLNAKIAMGTVFLVVLVIGRKAMHQRNVLPKYLF